MATTPPALGYGQRGAASLDSVNQWLRAQPDYQALIRSFGQDPNNVHLNDTQKTAVVRLAQAKGIVVDEGGNGQEVDDAGNFRATSHNLRTGLIVAGMAGAALLTAGAAGAFGGAALGGAEGGAAAAGALPAGVTLEGTAAGLGGASTAVGAGAAGAGAAAGGGAAAAGASAVPWSTIIGAGSSLFGNLFAANLQASAADRAAATAAAGTKYSADLTAKANADALKFQYANAENAYQNNEASRQGNYGIFAARERRLGTIGEEVGLGAREIPAYVPGVDPRFGSLGDAVGAPPASASGAPSGNPTDDAAILAAATDNYKKLGVAPTGPGSGPTDIAYMAQKIKETGGLTPTNVAYWFGPQGRIAAELAKATGGAASASTSPRPAAPATTATPFMPPTLAAGVPQAIGYYA